MRDELKLLLKTNSTQLFSELSKPGLSGVGTPYSRAQNTIAHCGLASFLTLGFISFGLNFDLAVVSTLAIGALWEVRGVVLAGKDRGSIIKKSLLDFLAYLIGACIVGGNDPVSVVKLVLAALILSYLSAIFGDS